MAIAAKLDARPDRIDLRDKHYSPPLRSLEPVYPPPAVLEKAMPLYLKHGLILDQGKEGACTGFGLAATINSLFWRRAILKVGPTGELAVDQQAEPPEKVSMRMLYHLARFYDEWPGEDYDGSSCRGAIKAWFKHGVCSDKVWPYRNPQNNRFEFVSPMPHWREDAAGRPLGVYYRIEKDSVTDMQAAIQEVGAIFCSARVHEGWGIPSVMKEVGHQSLPVIEWNAHQQETGGHAFALLGYNELGFVVQNSWGKTWGNSGFAILTYQDWVVNGTDAWVCVLGAKMRTEMPDYFNSSELNRGHVFLARDPVLHGMEQPRGAARADSDVWDMGKAYYHSVVMGNDGKVINRLVDQADGREAVNKVVLEKPLEYFKQRGNIPPRILIYAHGGLNSEGDSLERIKVLAPYIKENNIYPVFFTWKTGLLESVGSILADASSRLFPRVGGLEEFLEESKRQVKDALDRTLEVACENLGVKAVWSQMKQNAAAASRRENMERGVYLTTLALAELKKRVPELEIQLIGHSAGSIILGHMLDDFPRNDLTVTSCNLYAPACSVDFALRHYQKAVEKSRILSLDDLHLHLLTDEREQADSVGPYRKSLLYLVSRALEEQHKTPLLGMESAFDPDKAQKGHNYTYWHASTLNSVKKWQDFWGGRQLEKVAAKQVTAVAKWKNGRVVDRIKLLDTAHGTFDNDVEVIDLTLRRILGLNVLPRTVDNLDY